MLSFWSRPHRAFCDGYSRRDFLKVGALGAAGFALPALHAQTPTGRTPKAVIMILLPGGPPHIDMYDMKPDAPAEYRGEFKPIRTNVPGMDICELMPCQAAIADKLAIVRNLKMGTTGHQLVEVMTGFTTGIINGSGGTLRPSFGSVVSKLKGGRSAIPPFVTSVDDTHENNQGHLPAYLGGAHKALVAPADHTRCMEVAAGLGLPRNLTLDRLNDRKQLREALDTIRRDLDTRGQFEGVDSFTARALEVVASGTARDAFDVTKEPVRVRERYGIPSDLRKISAYVPQSFLRARRLVEAGVQVVTLSAFGWDTHDKNFERLRANIPPLDRAFAALVADLHERGLADDVAVVMWGEFGRTPRIGDYKGTPARDHYANASFVVFAGGGLKMGQVVGATDARAERPVGTPYRAQNVLATVYHALGIDPATTVPDGAGRPMHLLDQTRAIAELI